MRRYSENLQRAQALHRAGQLPQAQAIYEEILESIPGHPEALHMLGVLASQSGNHRRAVDLLGKAIEINPDNAVCFLHLGNAFHELRQVDAAVASFDRALAIKADFAPAYFNRGNALMSSGQLDAAVASFDRAIAHAPDYAAAFLNRGNALQGLDQLAAAVASYDEYLALRPADASALANRGVALKGMRQRDAAIASYDRAIAIRPDFAEAFYNRGIALQELGQFEAALASFGRAIALRPDYAEARWNMSLLLLLCGKLDAGWALYEWRWKAPGFPSPERRFPQALWLGESALAGKTILLHGEQGLGDALQFCRYAKLVANRGARVILEVPAPLVRLLQGLDGVAELIAKGGALPGFDCHCPLLSLPLAFKTRLATIPRSRRYLAGDPAQRVRWAQRLGVAENPRVGLVWSGHPRHRNDANRSVALAELIAHLPEGFDYVSLQKDVRAADAQSLGVHPPHPPHPRIRHFGAADIQDFSDTAALCELMDLVISVDTSVAHLSAALGRPTWILLPFNSDWRWLLDRDDSPWYPTATLYRQRAEGDWASVFARVATDLADFFACPAPRLAGAKNAPRSAPIVGS